LDEPPTAGVILSWRFGRVYDILIGSY